METAVSYFAVSENGLISAKQFNILPFSFVFVTFLVLVVCDTVAVDFIVLLLLYGNCGSPVINNLHFPLAFDNSFLGKTRRFALLS